MPGFDDRPAVHDDHPVRQQPRNPSVQSRCGRGASANAPRLPIGRSEASAGNEMTLEVEAIVDGGMHAAAAEVALI
jgi:hypothetical protein